MSLDTLESIGDSNLQQRIAAAGRDNFVTLTPRHTLVTESTLDVGQ